MTGAWGAAANALEYAGLIIKDHVVDDGGNFTRSDGTVAMVPLLNLSSLWRCCLVRLLDMDYQYQSAETLVGDTYDQKYFSQVAMKEEGILYIQDMMLTILRICLRALFSREHIKEVVLKYEINPSDPMQALMPKDMSLQIVVVNEFSMDFIEDAEAIMDPGRLTILYSVSNPIDDISLF